MSNVSMGDKSMRFSRFQGGGWGGWTEFTRRAIVAVVGVAALLTASACGADDGDGSDGGSGSKKVEVFTWWADGGEKAGLDGLVAQFGKDCAGQEFVNG